MLAYRPCLCMLVFTMPRKGQNVGPYQLSGLIGSGGTSEVFAAEDTRSGRGVALKVLREEHLGHPEVVLRFLNETLPLPLREFRHPCILEVLETSPPDVSPPYHAVEIMRGSLARRLSDGALAVSTALRLTRQTAEALDALHHQGIIHRDVKPSNLLLNDEADDLMSIKLSDFGLARFPDGVIGSLPVSTAEGTRLGTPDYMSPEQWENARAVGGAADVYSLGCTLYQMLSGRRPFVGESDARLRRQHLLAEPPPMDKSIPMGVRSLVADMMAKPAYRRPTARDVVARLLSLAGTR